MPHDPVGNPVSLTASGSPACANRCRALWFLFLACFIAVGINGFISSHHAPMTIGNGSYSSSDALLKEFIGITDGSKKIIETFDADKSMRPQFVFWPAQNNNTSMSWQIISYLGWPRTVDGLAVDREHLRQGYNAVRARRYSAVWLFGFAPPDPLHPGSVIDRGLIYIPLAPGEYRP